MAALPVDFDTPQTASGQLVTVTGTVPAGTSFVEAIQLDVLRTDSSHEYFSIATVYDNSAGTTPLDVNDTLNLAIVPKLETGETVTLTSYGSLKAEIVQS
ncbi:hypothetical protein ACFHWD_11075 [Clostridium sp. MT-14]|jgi:hypothetical protein|uniref:DUF5666 domain-containing protein n=1 Tax=Clostridium aromativorans TaxID=2836848 RepID=A0ABS8N3E6_9CLOT|nr:MULTISPECIES: hypothetical protein [Clostridium]KAA8679381.1 hypothetical protein F3O63_01215 [Clostridium sp. HV4-5-A1G]MCC9294319.1 hypothetical protein [Clostridium aromativorans]CAB1262451.1 conserved hypothetical protein [Clostridiaceae bacterium BL-3]